MKKIVMLIVSLLFVSGCEAFDEWAAMSSGQPTYGNNSSNTSTYEQQRAAQDAQFRLDQLEYRQDRLEYQQKWSNPPRNTYFGGQD